MTPVILVFFQSSKFELSFGEVTIIASAMKNILLITFSLFFILACSEDSSEGGGQQIATVPPAQQQGQPTSFYPYGQGTPYPYGYEYPGTGCTTGPQRFVRRDQYCAGLRNDVLNNHCALQNRYNSFREYCRHYRWQR